MKKAPARTEAVDEHITDSLQTTEKPFQPAKTDFDVLHGRQFAVSTSLRNFTDAALQGYLATFERDYTFERDPITRNALKSEVNRAKREIERRKKGARFEADRAFAPHEPGDMG